jgi:hypothetical protein
MRNKVFHILLAIALLITASFFPMHSAQAASCSGGQSCWYLDAATTTYSGDGQLCASGATTVVYPNGLQASGTNGTVKVELRWSSRCTANWSRGTIITSNSNTKQLGTKASPSNSGYYATDYYHNSGGVLPAGIQRYTFMVDGTHAVDASAGLNGAVCNGNKDSHNNYTGFPCNYAPLPHYSG